MATKMWFPNLFHITLNPHFLCYYTHQFSKTEIGLENTIKEKGKLSQVYVWKNPITCICSKISQHYNKWENNKIKDQWMT